MIPGPVGLAVLVLSLAGVAGQEKTRSPLEQAVQVLLPGAQCERASAFLSRAQQARVAELSGRDFARGMVFRYLVRDQAGQLLATAYLDRHRVRSKSETLLVLVGLAGRVKRVQVLAFAEPREYLPRKGWYRQFDGKALGPELRLRRGIDAVSGATLSSRACTRATRRVLAIHRVLGESEQDGQK